MTSNSSSSSSSGFGKDSNRLLPYRGNPSTEITPPPYWDGKSPIYSQSSDAGAGTKSVTTYTRSSMPSLAVGSGIGGNYHEYSERPLLELSEMDADAQILEALTEEWNSQYSPDIRNRTDVDGFELRATEMVDPNSPGQHVMRCFVGRNVRKVTKRIRTGAGKTAGSLGGGEEGEGEDEIGTETEGGFSFS